MFFSFAAALPRGYLYTVLVVAFDCSIKTATQISVVYSFAAFVTGPLTGLVVYKVRLLKAFIVGGVVTFRIAFSLLLRHRSGSGISERAGVVAGQALLGIGGGLFTYAATVGMQVSLKHQHVAVMSALYIAIQYVGSAMSSAVSGAIWKSVFLKSLVANLGDAALADQVFASPFPVVARYAIGTITRTAIIESYQNVQRLLCATGLSSCLPLLGSLR